MPEARWIDIGAVSGRVFHATYEGLGFALSPDSAPALLWGQAEEHLSIGQHQPRSLATETDPPVPVVRRALGGGAVWIDSHQFCFAFVVPQPRLARRPGEWFAWALAPMVDTFARFGIDVQRVDRDLWAGGKKIAGSGAATIGGCAVIASSFLMRFPARRFASCIACPSAGFRDWLVDGLQDSMTDWERQGGRPEAWELTRDFMQACGARFGWSFSADGLSSAEQRARDEALSEAEQDCGEPTTASPAIHAIKLNAGTFLAEGHDANGWVRVLTRQGRIARIAASEPPDQEILNGLVGSAPDADALAQTLGRALQRARARQLARQIAEIARTEP